MRLAQTVIGLTAAAAVTGVLVAGQAIRASFEGAAKSTPKRAAAPAAAPAAARGTAAADCAARPAPRHNARLTFHRNFLGQLKRRGISIAAVAPARLARGDLRMPVGSRVNAESPRGRLCYPGGFRLTKTKTKTTTTYEIDGIRIRFPPAGHGTVFATPMVKRTPRKGGELAVASFTLPGRQATTERVTLIMTPQWAKDLNAALGTRLHGGLPLGDFRMT